MATSRAYYQRNKKAIQAKNAERYKKNRERYLNITLVAHRLRKYGVTNDQYETMKRDQEGRCGICRKVPTETLEIDHNHTTGKVRKLLCKRCNLMIGYALESPETLRNAAAYLEGHNG